MQLERISFEGKEYAIMQVNKHYALCNYTLLAATVLSPGDYVLLDQHFNAYRVTEAQYRQMKGSKCKK